MGFAINSRAPAFNKRSLTFGDSVPEYPMAKHVAGSERMNAATSESKVSLVFRTFMAFPVFLLLTVILWFLVLGVWLMSGWFDERGWSVFGTFSAA